MVPSRAGSNRLVAARRQAEFQFDLTGGNLALDLANTVSRRDDPERRRDHLESYSDLISFATQDKVLSARQASQLRQEILRNEAEAARVHRKAVALREAVYRAFLALGLGKAAPREDVEAITEAAVEAMRHRRLARANGGYRWEWQSDSKNALEYVLWPIAQAAAELLTSEELKLVRWCEAPDCQWLFLDHSRNRSRRWCDMTSCGNRAKARRHYQRTRE